MTVDLLDIKRENNKYSQKMNAYHKYLILKRRRGPMICTNIEKPKTSRVYVDTEL